METVSKVKSLIRKSNPGDAKLESLLRLFESEFFDEWFALL